MKNDLPADVLEQTLEVRLPLSAILRLASPSTPAERLKILQTQGRAVIGQRGLYGTYVGISRADAQGGDHILELLDVKPEHKLTWEEAKAWAASVEGQLPTRKHAALLFANAADQFEAEYYWTIEQHESIGGFAWLQDFYDGNQDFTDKGFKYLARAVRRVPL